MLKGLKEKLFGHRLPTAEAFVLFKEVLEGHNRGLEIIADMGEKLGGEFLFDINYVRPAYQGLSSAVSESVCKFGRLTRGRYPKLPEAFGRIDSRVRDAIEEVEHASGRLVIFHEDITWETAGEVGGKNANISEARNLLGLRTPEGFALTFKAFSEFMRHNGLDRAVAGLSTAGLPDPDRLARLRGMVLDAEVPPALSGEIEAALARMRGILPGGFTLAVRSSAEDEDSDYHSFAGIFESVLGVPPDAAAVGKAYREVAASLFTERASAYRARLGVTGQPRMAVCCMAMVDAETAGVAFSTDPSGKPEITVSAAWGLGSSVVDGKIGADQYKVARLDEGGPGIVARHVGEKESMARLSEGGGTARTETPHEKRSMPSLTDEKILEVASTAARLERHFGRPQDIEWAFGEDGLLYLLQTRPLRVNYPDATVTRTRTAGPPKDAETLLAGHGLVVQGGEAAGLVFMVRRDADIAAIPNGAVVVSKTDTPDLVRAMPHISAILTDTGSPTSHMSSLCREFKVPAVVGTGGATKWLLPGQLVTLQADDEGYRVYKGVFRELLAKAGHETVGMETLQEYRRKRQVLRLITPLNLVDPLIDEFTPAKCRTVHDVLRFVHEKSVAELIDMAARGAGRGEKGVRLDLSVPAGILVMDIGGGLSSGVKGAARLEDVSSVPLRAVLAGMTCPGMWRSDVIPLKVGDLLSSMVRMPDIADGGAHTDLNLAVASREYVNLSMRFGYHFNMVDSYMAENARDNHIYFRFSGGATDMTKRSRRITLLAKILAEYGLNTKSKGDLIVARVSGLPKDEMEKALEKLGMLIAFSRQLDALLNSESLIEEYSKEFLTH